MFIKARIFNNKLYVTDDKCLFVLIVEVKIQYFLIAASHLIPHCFALVVAVVLLLLVLVEVFQFTVIVLFRHALTLIVLQ